jgi:acyl-CoA thioesterase-1
MLKNIPLIFLGLILSFSCEKPAQSSSPQSSEKTQKESPQGSQQQPVILFFGNSLTAGYGVEPEQSFPGLIKQRVDSLTLPYKVVNAGLSGETTASGVNRIEWVLRDPARIMVLELGANDGLRGIDPAETKKNLQEIVDLAKAKHPKIEIILAGMEAPPNMGAHHINTFRTVFKDLAQQNNLPLIPFLLEGVAGEPELNLADGIHPNEQGHKIVAENVWKVLGPLLR